MCLKLASLEEILDFAAKSSAVLLFLVPVGAMGDGGSFGASGSKIAPEAEGQREGLHRFGRDVDGILGRTDEVGIAEAIGAGSLPNLRVSREVALEDGEGDWDGIGSAVIRVPLDDGL